MQDAAPSCPMAFDLCTTERLGMRVSSRVVLEEGALTWTARSTSGRLPFDQIATVRLAVHSGEEPFAECAALAAGDSVAAFCACVDADEPDEVAAYRDFVVRFIERLGPARRQRIRFRAGPARGQRMMSTTVGVIGEIVFIGLLTYGIASGDYRQDGEWALLLLCLLFILLFAAVLLGALRQTERDFDPCAIPPGLLPAPRPARAASRSRRSGP